MILYYFKESDAMPQITKGGKFIYGWSLINEDYSVYLPPQVVREYNINRSGKIILMSSSKITGGFCVSSKKLFLNSKLSSLTSKLGDVFDYRTEKEELIFYNDRFFTWTNIDEKGSIRLNKKTLDYLELKVSERLLVIRSSSLAFTLGAKGPIFERVAASKAEIKVF
jgi:hypothetical protein